MDGTRGNNGSLNNLNGGVKFLLPSGIWHPDLAPLSHKTAGATGPAKWSKGGILFGTTRSSGHHSLTVLSRAS
jgi:hypothetical protein